MWTGTISNAALSGRSRWKVEYFCGQETSDEMPGLGAAPLLGAGFAARPLGLLFTERKRTVEPVSLGVQSVNYLGLEHVASHTGELVAFAPRPASSVKSRSKVFGAGDVLYGRLRPTLNKVYLAQEPVVDGICSTEFLVLAPRRDQIGPHLLRWLLSSSFVQSQVARFLVGSALPRLNLSDLASIRVPVPPTEIAAQYEAYLAVRFARLCELRQRLAEFPAQTDAALMQGLSSGQLLPEEPHGEA